MHRFRISEKLSRTKVGTPAQMGHQYTLTMKMLADGHTNICGTYQSLWKGLNFKF